jgi:Protein of unknown function (DUF2752)
MWESTPSGAQMAAWQLADHRAVAVRLVRSDRRPAGPLTIAAAVGLVIGAALAAFGMPPIDLHSPTHYLGIMDPLCGMTRGSAATLRGDLAKAWWYNPASPAVIAGGLILVARWMVGRLTGLWVDLRVQPTPLLVVAVGLALMALEVNQQIHIARLR